MINLFTGLIAGSIHVVSGPDHLSAVAPLSIEEGRSSWRMGLLWGVGHTGGVLLVGLIALLGRELIPIDLISQWSERIVGVVLIGIGLWGLRKALKHRVHIHKHTHEGEEHTHIHLHETETQHASPRAHIHTHAAFAVGIIHGLAGSSHFLGVLPALALPTTGASILYLSGYGIGTISSMVVFTAMLGVTAKKLADRGIAVYKKMLIAFSSAAIGIGVFWLFM
ncbi:sulfite exporter TauE/SafE family protein [candidate division KSB1 bacterium]